MSKINVNLLDRVVNFLEKHPEHWAQDTWMDRDWDLPDNPTVEDFEHCGTTGCIAGWTVLLGDGKRWTGGGSTALRAAELLGLDLEEADKIFLYLHDEDTRRSVSWPQMKQKISEVTGVKFN